MLAAVSPRAFLAVGLLGAATAVSAISCDAVPTFSYSRSFTSTVTVSTERVVGISAPVSMEIVRARRTDILISVNITVTASSSTVARTRAEGIELSILQTDGATARIELPSPEDFGIDGSLRVEVPSDIEVQGASSNVVIIRGVEKPIIAIAGKGVQVEGAAGSVQVSVDNGNAVVDTRLDANASVEITVGSGNIDLALPARISAEVTAIVQQQGEVSIAHAGLPAAIGLGKTRYGTSVNGGLSAVRALITTGRITIRSR